METKGLVEFPAKGLVKEQLLAAFEDPLFIHLVGFLKAEVAQLETREGNFYNDNLVLEIADRVLTLPAGLIASEFITEIIRATVLEAVEFASRVRARISWGLVRDWKVFKGELKTLSDDLVELIRLAALSMELERAAREDPDATT